MNLNAYKFLASDTFLDFEFESNGPKGKVRKIVRYSLQNAGGITYFNLGFGDLNPKKIGVRLNRCCMSLDTNKITTGSPFERTSITTEESRAFLEKNGFPKELLTKK